MLEEADSSLQRSWLSFTTSATLVNLFADFANPGNKVYTNSLPSRREKLQIPVYQRDYFLARELQSCVILARGFVKNSNESACQEKQQPEYMARRSKGKMRNFAPCLLFDCFTAILRIIKSNYDEMF
jgi:hypothetical protein